MKTWREVRNFAWSRSQKFVKNPTQILSHFSISAVAGICVNFLSKNMGELRLDRWL